VQHLGATLLVVPTKHPRVSVTLTPPLQEARERLRRQGVNASIAELALAGARELLAEAEARDADDQRRRELRKRLTVRMRTGDAVDVDAIREARETGWTRA
jgi:Arc/MetJ-type ribon-helix-helix transcriptional regulator